MSSESSHTFSDIQQQFQQQTLPIQQIESTLLSQLVNQVELHSFQQFQLSLKKVVLKVMKKFSQQHIKLAQLLKQGLLLLKQEYVKKFITLKLVFQIFEALNLFELDRKNKFTNLFYLFLHKQLEIQKIGPTQMVYFLSVINTFFIPICKAKRIFPEITNSLLQMLFYFEHNSKKFINYRKQKFISKELFTKYILEKGKSEVNQQQMILGWTMKTIQKIFQSQLNGKQHCIQFLKQYLKKMEQVIFIPQTITKTLNQNVILKQPNFDFLKEEKKYNPKFYTPKLIPKKPRKKHHQ